MGKRKIVFRQIDKIFLFLFFVSCLNSFLGLLFYLALMIYWLYGTEGGLKALIFLTTRGILSTAVAATPSFQTIRWIIIIGSAVIIFINIRLVGQKKRIYNAVLLCTIVFDIIVLFSCIAICSYPITSIFKMICYSISLLSVVAAIAATNEYIDWKSFVTLLYFPLFGISVILIPFSRFRIVNENFQGVFNHVNMFGIVAAIIIAFALRARVAESHKKVTIVFVAIMIFMIFLSGSRTGMFTSIAIILISFITNRQHISKKIFYLLIIGCLILLACNIIPAFREGVYQFVYKHNDDSIWYSRIEIITTYRNHYNESKLVGTGFLVPYIKNVVDYSLNFNLSVEPGNMWWMLLGDVGILGLISFVWMLIIVFINGSVSRLHMLLTPIFICMGEMVFFNPNNMSILLYMLMGIYLFDDNGVKSFYE